MTGRGVPPSEIKVMKKNFGLKEKMQNMTIVSFLFDVLVNYFFRKFHNPPFNQESFQKIPFRSKLYVKRIFVEKVLSDKSHSVKSGLD